MRYRGYEIYVSRSDLAEGLMGDHPPRLSCEIYMISDPDLNTMLDCFTLTQGVDIPDLSEESIDDAIRRYVNSEYGHLYAAELETVSERTQTLMGRLITQLGQTWSAQTVYDTLSNEIGMTDDEIRLAGASHLVPYFDPDDYSQTIADHMVFIGTENTITGSWDISYQYLNKKFFTDLPVDKVMVKKIGESLNHNYPESVEDFTVDDEGFHVKFNPKACHYPLDDEDQDEDQTNDMITAEDMVEQAAYAMNAPDCCSDSQQAQNMLGMLGANVMDESIYHDEDEHPGIVQSM